MLRHDHVDVFTGPVLAGPDGHHGRCQQCPDLTFICVKNSQ